MMRIQLSFIACVLCFGTLIKGQSDISTSQEVLLWDIHEQEFHNDINYRNPFRDVTLEVRYTRPDGTMTDFWGFYDGRKVRRARFMPDQLGGWEYHALFSDGTPAGQGSFEVIPSKIPGLVTQDVSNPLWIGFSGGNMP